MFLMAQMSSSEADAIQRQMRELRAELRDDVQDFVVSAHKLGDIGNYVRAYPWLCAGAALAAGYLVVPQRAVIMKPDAEALVELARKHQLVVKNSDDASPKKRRSLMGQLISLAAATLLQGGVKIVTAHLTETLANTAPARSNGHAKGATP